MNRFERHMDTAGDVFDEGICNSRHDADGGGGGGGGANDHEGTAQRNAEDPDKTRKCSSSAASSAVILGARRRPVRESVSSRIRGRSMDKELAFLETQDNEVSERHRGACTVDQRAKAARAKQLLKGIDQMLELRIVQQRMAALANCLPPDSIQFENDVDKDKVSVTRLSPPSGEGQKIKADAPLLALSTRLRGVIRMLCSTRDELRLHRAPPSADFLAAREEDSANCHTKREFSSVMKTMAAGGRHSSEPGRELERDEDKYEDVKESSTGVRLGAIDQDTRSVHNFDNNAMCGDDDEDNKDEAGNGVKTGNGSVLLGGQGVGMLEGMVEVRLQYVVLLQAVWLAVQDGTIRCRPFWKENLELWQRRVAVGWQKHFNGVTRGARGGGGEKKRRSAKRQERRLEKQRRQLKVVHGEGLFAQAEAALVADLARGLKKAHPKRKRKRVEAVCDGLNKSGSDDSEVGLKALSLSSKEEGGGFKGGGKGEDGDEQARHRGQCASGDLEGLDLDVFDDREFYHCQLKEFLEGRGTGASSIRGGSRGGHGDDSGGPQAASLVVSSTVRRRLTKTNGADTRASKGRKLRYGPLPKLEHFMFPEPPPTRALSAGDFYEFLFAGKK